MPLKYMHDQLEERVSENLARLIGIFHIMRNRGCGDGVKPPALDPQYYIMGFLLEEELPISEIGRRLQRSKPNMTAIIGKLLHEGKVRRISDRKDRRVTRISITRKGRLAMRERKKAVKAAIRRNLAPLSRRDKERLCSSLEVVNEMAQRLGSDKHGRS